MAKIRAFSQEQMTYIEARALQDTAENFYGAESQEWLDAHTLLRQAEDVLIAWGKEKLSPDPRYAQIAVIFESKLLMARRKLVELLMQWDSNS